MKTRFWMLVGKYGLLIGSIFIIVISSVLLYKTYEEYTITKEGNEVIVKILEAPDPCDTIGKRGGYCRLLFIDEVFVKKAGREFCHLVSQKDFVKMYTNPKRTVLIFNEEHQAIDFLYGFLLLAFGLVIAVKSIGNWN